MVANRISASSSAELETLGKVFGRDLSLMVSADPATDTLLQQTHAGYPLLYQEDVLGVLVFHPAGTRNHMRW